MDKIKIFYGIDGNLVDVTEKAFEKCLNNNTIKIPMGDNARSKLFNDHIYGTLKSIFVLINEDMTKIIDKDEAVIDLTTNKIIIDTSKSPPINKLHEIHNKLKIKYGNMRDEYPEQLMASTFLTGSEKVLEIGGNIGRNSLVISSILNNSSNLVVLESDNNIALQLKENRDINNLNFHIEDSALSKRKLIQNGWDTIPSDVILDGYKEVKTIDLHSLNSKYKIDFDTLVLDCEGAFYYILMDMPEILDNIKLIIMENDYKDYVHKKYVDDVLLQNGFKCVYNEAGGWGPCYSSFFQAWKK